MRPTSVRARQIVPGAALRAGRGVLGAAFVAGILALMAARLWLAWVQPLWFDEAWSLMVATAPDWRSVVHEALTDVNAPLGYVLLHAWTMLAGPSDFALRLPGLIAVAAAAVLPVAWPSGLRREARLTLAVTIFAWWGLTAFQAGRAYGLLLALSTAQLLAFVGLLDRPTLRRAGLWAALAALAILTHYYAILVTAVQGLAYLALRPRDALRSWPAALAFAPAAGWLAIHAPRLQAFAGTDVAWHPQIGANDAIGLIAGALDPSAPFVGLLLAVALTAAALARRGRDAILDRPLWIAAAASLGALGVTLVTGALHPGLTGRYLLPVAPGLLLGLVLCAERTTAPRPFLAGLAAVYLATALRPDAFSVGLESRGAYGFETASQVLMRHGTRQVVFVWDHEVTALMPPETLGRLGSVFFRRAGYPAQVTPLLTRPGEDVNRLALAAATGPRPGVIWIYNRAGHTAARAHPPRIAEIDPGWACERIGDATVGTLACWRAR